MRGSPSGNGMFALSMTAAVSTLKPTDIDAQTKLLTIFSLNLIEIYRAGAKDNELSGQHIGRIASSFGKLKNRFVFGSNKLS